MGLAHSPRIVTSGLVGYWDAGNPKSYPGSGTSWYDLGGGNKTGTLTNGPTYSSNSVVFDGIDDNIQIGSLSNSFASFTVIVWFYATAVENYRNVLDCNFIYYSTQNNAGPRLEMNAAGNLTWVYSDQGANALNNFYSHGVITSGMTPSVWRSVALTFDGPSNTSKTYLNGTDTGNVRTLTGTATGFGGTFNNVVIGKGWSDVSQRVYKGNISNVIFYNRALSATEIQQNFNALRGRFGI